MEKNNHQAKKRNKKKPKVVNYEYCFGCKDLRPVTKDGQCKECFNYIVF